MLIAVGPGVDSIQDYTNYIDFRTISVKQVQGDTLDTCDFTIHDPTCDFTVCAEDDVLVLDETDTNGWPTVNLLFNAGFEGSFSGGVGASWAVGSQPSGASFANATGHPIYGAHAQQFTMTNCAANAQPEINQIVTLGQDEGGNPIVSPNYVVSGWVRADTVWGGTSSGPVVYVDWLDINNAFISRSTLSVYFHATTTGMWYRWQMSATAPSTAYFAKVRLTFFVGAGSITGSCYWDSIQFELATFGAVGITAPNAPLRNSYMNLNSGGVIVDEWFDSGLTATGVTFSTVTNPILNGAAAQAITIANMANASQAYIWQGEIGGQEVPLNHNAQYTARMTYQITTALSGAHAWFEILFYDSGNNLLGSGGFADGPANEAVSGGGLANWHQLTIPIGPGTATPIPATTATIQVLAGVQTTSGSNSGKIVIGQIDCLVSAAQFQPNANALYLSALAAGMYPTPYCDQNQQGINFDRILGLYYRQFRLFGGFARTVEYNYATEPEADIKMTATDYGCLLQESPVTLRVNQETDKAMIKAVCDYGANQGYLEGLDYQTYVQNISIVNQMLFNWRTARDVLSEIANHTVAAYWVDYHKFLHYAPSLAISAPFGLSDHPDYITTFPMERWVYTDDSTQSETSPVVEGSTQLSAGQPVTFNGNGSQTTFVLNNGNAVVQIDSCTVGGVGQLIGLASVNTFAQGYNALLDPTNGNLTFNTAPPSGSNNVSVIYRYNAPVIVRLHWPPAESKKHGKYYTRHEFRHHHWVTILVRRKVHKYHSESHISSQQSAIDQANADLSQNAKPQALTKAYVRSPPSPTATTLRPGMAIQVTHTRSDFNKFLLQVVEVTITSKGNGVIMRELGLGAYMPDFMIHQMHANRRTVTDSYDDGSTTLDDIVSTSDGWAITDEIAGTVLNVGAWGPPTSSTYNGTGVWG